MNGGQLKSAFTLVELLVVIAIIGAIAGITYPVIASARIAGKRSASASNMKQCATVINLYLADYDSSADLPSIDVVRSILPKSITCDPNDSWRHNCTEESQDPLVGSYAYVRGLRLLRGNEGLAQMPKPSNPTLFVSIFYSDSIPSPFSGDAPPVGSCQGGFCKMPTTVLSARQDTSVSVVRTLHLASKGMDGFSWPLAFYAKDTEVQVLK